MPSPKRSNCFGESYCAEMSGIGDIVPGLSIWNTKDDSAVCRTVWRSYGEEVLQCEVVKIIQSYNGVINMMGWRK